jgi:hypothetical protein
MPGRAMDRPAWLLGILIALTLVAAQAGCGSGDSENGGGDTPGPGATEADRAAIAGVMRQLRVSHNAGDGTAYCGRLTVHGQREIREFAETTPAIGKRDCADFMSEVARRVVETGGAQPPVRVRAIAIDGDRARITMQGGQVGIKAIATYELAKEGGEWKLDNPISGGETRHLPKQKGT